MKNCDLPLEQPAASTQKMDDEHRFSRISTGIFGFPRIAVPLLGSEPPPIP